MFLDYLPFSFPFSPQGLLPVHCAAAHGLTSVIEALLVGEEGRAMRERLGGEAEEVNLPY